MSTKAPFVWDDPLLLDQQLSEEERMMRDAVHGFTQDRLMPVVVEWNRNEIFERDLMREFGEMGFLGGTLAPLPNKIEMAEMHGIDST